MNNLLLAKININTWLKERFPIDTLKKKIEIPKNSANDTNISIAYVIISLRLKRKRNTIAQNIFSILFMPYNIGIRFVFSA